VEIVESHWSAKQFGSDEQARAVRDGIGWALRDMQENASASHKEAAVSSTQIHGVARYRGSFERVAEELKDLPGAQLVKPNGFQFELVRIGDGLIFPFCFSKKDVSARKAKIQNVWSVIRELFAFAPPSAQADLFGEYAFDPTAVELRPRLAALPPETRLVLVPFACNADGLLKPYWGVASLADESGTLEWIVDPEPLPVPNSTTAKPTIPAQPVSQPASFNGGNEPEVALSARSASDRMLEVSPVTEIIPTIPVASENDES
jgi:hypothetical protein